MSSYLTNTKILNSNKSDVEACIGSANDPTNRNSNIKLKFYLMTLFSRFEFEIINEGVKTFTILSSKGKKQMANMKNISNPIDRLLVKLFIII